VRLYPSAGLVSVVLPRETAQQISRSVEATDDKSIEIVYVGDYDPAD
jgi:hypothetical protein